MTRQPARLSNRYFIPGLAKLYEGVGPFSYSLMRFCTGAILVPHGVQKLFFGALPIKNMIALGLTPPDAWAYLVAVNESVIAAMLAIGLLTRFAALGIAIEMAVISFHIQWPNGYFWTQKGFEYPLLLMLLSIAIFFNGGGRYSADSLIGREL